jgi:hypothetical protein
MTQKYLFIQDQDSHWFYIKKEEKILFNEMCELAYQTDDFDNFLNTFEQNMICCHPSNFHDFYNENGSKKD